MNTSDIFRFFEKVYIPKNIDDCWIFTGGLNSCGRGNYWLNGKTVQAHRISYELFKGTIPDGLFVCHHCDNGKCVNPVHLFIGTCKDNVDDMMRKGRKTILRGEDDPKSKLTNRQVLKIVELYKTGKYTQPELGEKFKVTRSTVLSIIRGNNWKHITNITTPIRRPF